MLQGFCFLNHKRLQASCRYLQGAEPANMGPANTCPAGSWLLGLMAMNTGSQRFPRCCDRGNLVSPGITRLPLVPLLRFPSNPPGRRCDHGNLASSGVARLPLVPPPQFPSNPPGRRCDRGNLASYVSIYASHDISSIDPPPTYRLVG